MPPYLLSQEAFAAFLLCFNEGRLTRTEWNHAAHLSIAADTVFNGGGATEVRHRILEFNKSLGIVSTPDYGYHETVTCFWVERLQALIAHLGRGASPYDAARAAVAAFAHRGRLFDAYYSYDITASRTARAAYQPPDIPTAS